MSKYKIKVVSSENKKLVTIFTTWERKCGIAKYSQFLYKELENIINEDKIPIKVKIVENINPNSVNPIYWTKMALNLKKSDIIHIQHEFGLFGCFWRGKICGLASYFFYLIISILKKIKKYKIITTMHEVYEDKKIRSLIRKAYYRLREWPIIFFSDLIIVHTNKARQELISRAMKKKIVTIPHGSYQTPIFLDELECKKRLGVEGKWVITIFGFIHRKKGYEKILKILPNLENTVLLIAGSPAPWDAEYVNQLSNIIKSMNLETKVILLTKFIEEENLPVIFNASDIILLPYEEITQSGVLSMALAYRKPVIASKLSTFLEVAQVYGCIELAESEEEWLNKIREILHSKEKKEIMKKASQKYWENTNWKNIAKLHLNLYLNLLKLSKLTNL